MFPILKVYKDDRRYSPRRCARTMTMWDIVSSLISS